MNLLSYLQIKVEGLVGLLASSLVVSDSLQNLSAQRQSVTYRKVPIGVALAGRAGPAW